MIAPRYYRLACACAAVCGLLSGVADVARCDEALEPIADYSAFAAPLLTQYCADCHAGSEPESGIGVDQLRGGDNFQQDRRHWIKVLQHLRAGDMPPPDMPQPTDEERLQLVDWVAAKLELIDCDGEVDPGRVTLRRLNREHYRNTVRDLLGVRYDSPDLLPPDELAYGFDNNGDVLSMSPLVFEKYLAAAEDVAREAVPAAEDIRDQGARVKLARTDDFEQEPRMLFTNGKFIGNFQPPRDGRYAVRVAVSGDQAGDEPVRMELWLGERRLKQLNVWSDNDETEMFVAQFDAQASEKIELGVSFTNDYYNPAVADRSQRDRNLIVHEMDVVGPLNLADDAPRRARGMLCKDSPAPDAWQGDGDWQAIAQERLQQLVPQAYRRATGDGDVERLLEIMQAARTSGDTYERALQLAVQAVLISPQFLFVGNLESQSDEQQITPIDDFALASRLSYFLWGTMPDDVLLDLAARGQLRDELKPQVQRMLRDARVRRLSSSFAGQWLETRQLASVKPDPDMFPEFDDELREAMARETEKLFDAVVVSDLPVDTLIDADFTFLNERLARHYGIEGVKGNYFRKVSLTDQQRAAGRGGVLGLAGVLTVTSSPDRTSPVTRGKFVLANLLGDEPPPPPPNVPPLPEGDGEELTGTLRQRLEQHRDDPACASCHAQIDPLGFALEGFDALGRIRDTDAGQPIDDSGELPDGTKFTGASGLRTVLADRKDQFRKALAEKLLTYALGRGLEYYDQCAVREIVAATEANDNRFSALVMAIVTSRPFLLEGAAPPTTEAQP